MDKDTNTLREALEYHICRFNDGEQICDCFVEGFTANVNQKREIEKGCGDEEYCSSCGANLPPK